MIRIQQYWMAVEPIDMRAGMETVLGKVVAVFGSAQEISIFVWLLKKGSLRAQSLPNRWHWPISLAGVWD